jgi:hypothetical protein
MSSSDVNNLLSRNFAPIVVFCLAFAAILSFQHNPELLRAAALSGLAQALAVVVIRQLASNNFNVKNVLFKALHVLFVPRPHHSIGSLTVGIGSFTVLLLFHISALGMGMFAQAFTLISGFLAASSLVKVLADWLWDYQYQPTVAYRIDNEYVDIFLASMVASAFLGITYSELPAFKEHFMPHAMVLLPLLLGLGSLFITYAVAFVVEASRTSQFANRHLVSFVSMLLLLVLARVLTDWLLPSTFAKHGQFFTSTQLRYILLGSIFGGFLAGRMAALYKYFAQSFVEFLLANRLPVYAAVPVRWAINAMVGYAPIAISVVAIVLAYVHGDLYGAATAMLGMVTNAGASRFVVGNRLTVDNLYYLTDGAKRKLKLLLPTVNELLARYRAAARE